jgi:hypothetical protein
MGGSRPRLTPMSDRTGPAHSVPPKSMQPSAASDPFSALRLPAGSPWIEAVDPLKLEIAADLWLVQGEEAVQGKGGSPVPAQRQFEIGPVDFAPTEDLREALRARKSSEKPGTSGGPSAGTWMVNHNLPGTLSGSSINILFIRRWAAPQRTSAHEGLP